MKAQYDRGIETRRWIILLKEVHDFMGGEQSDEAWIEISVHVVI